MSIRLNGRLIKKIVLYGAVIFTVVLLLSQFHSPIHIQVSVFAASLFIVVCYLVVYLVVCLLVVKERVTGTKVKQPDTGLEPVTLRLKV